MVVFTKNASQPTFALPSPVWGRTGPRFFAYNSRKPKQIVVKRALVFINLTYVYTENCNSMLCQVIRLWRHMAGHVRPKSEDFAICRTWVSFLASYRITTYPNLHADYLVLMESKHHIQWTQGQGHARSRFIWPVFSLLLVNLVVTSNRFSILSIGMFV